MPALTTRIDLSDSRVPEQIFIRSEDIIRKKSWKNGSIVFHGSRHNPKKTAVYETIPQMDQAEDPDTYTQSISSAGSNQGDATLVPGYLNVVTGGVTGGGVILMDSNAVRIDNNHDEDVLVYPPVGENFEFKAVNAPYTIEPGESVTFAKD